MPTLLHAETARPTDPFDGSKLDSLSKWASGGFALLTAVLTFFGIKNGYLDRILAENATAALWVFVLVGLGVVASLFGAAVKPAVYLLTAAVVLSVTALGAVTALLLPNFTDDKKVPTWLLICLLVAGVVLTAVAYVRELRWSLAAALLVFAVVSTSMGLYGAAKLSIASKGNPSELAVTAKLVTDHGRPAVSVTVKAGNQQHADRVVVAALRTDLVTRKPQAVTLDTRELIPDDVNRVDDTFIVPASGADWDALSIRACAGGAKCTPAEIERIVLGAPAGRVSLAGAMRPSLDGKRVTASMSGAGLRNGQFVLLTVTRGNYVGGRVGLVMRVVPDAAGRVRWSLGLGMSGTGWLVLRAQQCQSTCQKKGTVLAAFRTG